VTAHEYDAVICDLKMPKLRGDEFYLKARELRPAVSDRSFSSLATRPTHAPVLSRGKRGEVFGQALPDQRADFLLQELSR
jgi:CheY-like chemotaxis protein